MSGAHAADLSVAFYNVGLDRDGPGLLLRDIRSGKDPQAEAAAAVIAHTSPDVIVLSGIDYDHGMLALSAFADRIGARGVPYPERFAFRPNTGMATDVDLDGDGRLRGAGDAQGWGRFAGADGLAILSRLPILRDEARDFSGFLWKDLPDTLLPAGDAANARAIRRLSATGHWRVPVGIPGGRRVDILVWQATPPVFGKGDLNRRRNHDEAAFWRLLLDHRLPWAPPRGAFVLVGGANLDPVDGDGNTTALRGLLADPRIRDPRPASAGGRAAAQQGGANDRHRGDPALDTADWRDDPGPGNLRVDYVLPSADFEILDAQVFWPLPGQPLAAEAGAASAHRLVMLRLRLP